MWQKNTLYKLFFFFQMKNSKYWKGLTFIQTWWKYKLIQVFWKIVHGLLKNLSIYLPYNPEISLLGIYPRTQIMMCTL